MSNDATARGSTGEPRRFSVTQWLNLFAALITIVGALVALLRAVEGLPSWILAAFVCIMMSVAWTLLIVEEFRWHRKARYAEAQTCIHNAYHSIRDAWFTLSVGDSLSTAMEQFRRAVESFAAGFSLIAGVHCRVCVKDLICPNPKAEPLDRGLCTRTLCRSEEVIEPRRPATEDWITDNSDFYVLFKEPRKRWFFSNDLPRLLGRGYKNSHWTQEVIENRTFNYVSACVWPIRKAIAEGTIPEALHEEQDILGFLCVDSLARNAFRERYDVYLGAAFADTLYPFIRALRQRCEDDRLRSLPNFNPGGDS